MTRGGAALVLALTTVTATPVVAQNATLPFVVGIWGEGDAIIPVADFDGRSWRSSWPAPLDSKPDPRPLQRIPPAWWGRSTFRPTWEIVEANGHRRSIQITGTGEAGMGSSCSINVALKTNVPANIYQYGTVLAANRPGVIEPVQALTSDVPEWQTVSSVLPGIYQHYETVAWKDVPDNFRPDMTAPLSPPTLLAAFAAMDEMGQYVYFESSREFAPGDNQAGDAHSFITGWLWRRSSTMPFQLVSVRAGINDGDGKGAASFHPLGVVRQGAQRFWLGSLNSYAYDGVAVLDVRRAGIKQRLLVDYPGC